MYIPTTKILTRKKNQTYDFMYLHSNVSTAYASDGLSDTFWQHLSEFIPLNKYQIKSDDKVYDGIWQSFWYINFLNINILFRFFTILELELRRAPLPVLEKH